MAEVGSGASPRLLHQDAHRKRRMEMPAANVIVKF
jgi:hypothetical protein